MGTYEMLEPTNRREAVESYLQSQTDNGYRIGLTESGALEDSVEDPVYGHVVASNLEHFTGLVDTEPALIHRAIRTLISLTYRAENTYRANPDLRRPLGWYYSDQFRAALRLVQADMASGGQIATRMPESYATTSNEGYYLAKNANDGLEVSGAEVGRLLADANYSLYFSQATMTDGSRFLGRSIEDAIEADSEMRMPHLDRSNFAIGQIAQMVARRTSGRLEIIDMGSGTGSTLAAIAVGLKDTGLVSPNVGITGVESNIDFYGVLANFGSKIDNMLPFASADIGQQLAEDREASIMGGVSLVHSDLIPAIRQVQEFPVGNHDISLLTANYVWHRLPTQSKVDIVEHVGSKAKNSVFVIADLIQNASTVNRTYFNFGNNGPLNAGNLDLKEIFGKQGYTVIEVTKENAQYLNVHPKLANALDLERQNDGYLWVAYKGEAAEAILEPR